MTSIRKIPEAVRLAASQPLFGMPEADDGTSVDRTIRYAFSDASVARDHHTIAANAWGLENFLKNPVFLWAHDAGEPPIGRVVNLRSQNGILRGEVEYADRDIYPFADTVYRLVKGGFINATSTSWIPLDWTIARDKSRPGGVDFTKVELLEISQVPVPALPTALVEARRQGIDTKPVFDWAERMLDSGGYLILPRTELEALRMEAKMPVERKVSPEVTSEVTVTPVPDPIVTVERALSREARQRLVDVHATMQSAHITMSSAYSNLTGMLEDQSLFDDEADEDPSESDDDGDEDEMIARRLRKARAKARQIKLTPAAAT